MKVRYANIFLAECVIKAIEKTGITDVSTRAWCDWDRIVYIQLIVFYERLVVVSCYIICIIPDSVGEGEGGPYTEHTD